MTLRLPLALTGHRTRVSAHCGLSVNLGNIWNRQQCSFVAVYRMLLKLCSWKSFIFHTKNQINSKAYILNPNIELGKATVISYVSRLSFVIIDICIAAILLFLWHWNVQIQWNSPHIEFLVFFLQVSLYAKHTQLWYLIICMITKIFWIFTHLLWYILTWADSLNQICISTEPLAKLMTLKLRYNGIIIFVAPILIS